MAPVFYPVSKLMQSSPGSLVAVYSGIPSPSVYLVNINTSGEGRRVEMQVFTQVK